MSFGTPHRHYDECDSTNDLARDWALHVTTPAPQGAVVTATTQTHGRGRRGRAWSGGAGQSLLASFIVRPKYPISDSWQLAFVAAVAVADALEKLGADPLLKWPNDVILDGRKAAGILVETVGRAGNGDWIGIVGIGVNGNQDRFETDSTYALEPISLKMHLGTGVVIEDVLAAIAGALENRCRQNDELRFGEIMNAWRSRCARGIQVERLGVKATLETVYNDGSAVVLMPDGTFQDWRTVDG